MKRARLIPVVIIVAVIALSTWYSKRRAGVLTLTGIVTTNEVVVSSQIPGQVARLLVAQGDSVAVGQLLAELAPGELSADRDYFVNSASAMGSQVAAGEAELRFQETQAAQQIKQADAALAMAVAQREEAKVTADNNRVEWERQRKMLASGGVSPQEAENAHAALNVAEARLNAAEKHVEEQRAALMTAQATVNQVATQRNALAATRQQRAAAVAQTSKADVRLAYREIRAPIAGTVDVSVVRAGEVVNVGSPIVTIIDPATLWVRADVEETYIDRVRVNDSLTVRLPWGEERRGQVIFRGVDADFATQRDVSRSKRDIRTFEIRVRVDNHDRRLAVGMTASVILPVRTDTRAAK